MFEKSLAEKAQHEDFRYDILELLTDKEAWIFEEACETVKKQFICLLPGEPWKAKEKS